MTLRLPPPLERDLRVEPRGDGVVLLDGDDVVAEAVPAEVTLEAPLRATPEGAREASRRYVPEGPPTFHGCFSCGPLREEGDGLCIYPGRLPGSSAVAAPWTAHEPSVPVVWAAIDCSGAYAIGLDGRGETVLGRMAARVERLPREGEQCVVVGWPAGEEGRKLFAGTALLGEDGGPIAAARQTWIVPREHA